MRVYHERPRVPVGWWLAGLVTIAVLATETVAGWPLPVAIAIYAALVGLVVAMLLNWGRPSIDVTGTELRVGTARLPLADTGEVTALDEKQTRSLRGPHGDPAAYLFIRPYLRVAVYVEVTRRPAELAAAISASRPAARVDGATMG